MRTTAGSSASTHGRSHHTRAHGRSHHTRACRPCSSTTNGLALARRIVTPGAGDTDGAPPGAWSTVSDDAEVGGRPTRGRAYTAAGSVTAEAPAVAGCGGNEGAREGCTRGVAADTTTPVFSSVEGGSFKMPGASTSKGSVAPAPAVPAGETLFDARGVTLLTRAPPKREWFLRHSLSLPCITPCCACTGQQRKGMPGRQTRSDARRRSARHARRSLRRAARCSLRRSAARLARDCR